MWEGGTSRPVDDPVVEGYTELTVFDLSSTALVVARQRWGDMRILFTG